MNFNQDHQPKIPIPLAIRDALYRWLNSEELYATALNFLMEATVIEDQRPLQAQFVAWLNHHGYGVTSASYEVEIAQRQGGPPQVGPQVGPLQVTPQMLAQFSQPLSQLPAGPLLLPPHNLPGPSQAGPQAGSSSQPPPQLPIGPSMPPQQFLTGPSHPQPQYLPGPSHPGPQFLTGPSQPGPQSLPGPSQPGTSRGPAPVMPRPRSSRRQSQSRRVAPTHRRVYRQLNSISPPFLRDSRYHFRRYRSFTWKGTARHFYQCRHNDCVSIMRVIVNLDFSGAPQVDFMGPNHTHPPGTTNV